MSLFGYQIMFLFVIAALYASVSLPVKLETACLCHNFLVIKCFEDKKYCVNRCHSLYCVFHAVQEDCMKLGIQQIVKSRVKLGIFSFFFF